MSSIARPIIELQTNASNKVLRFEQIQRLDASDFSCTLVVHSGDFAVTRPFYFSDHWLRPAIESLSLMDRTLAGEAILKYRYEHDFIKLEVDRLGHVIVRGEVFEYTTLRQHLLWAFETDQTVLGPFRRDLQSLL